MKILLIILCFFSPKIFIKSLTIEQAKMNPFQGYVLTDNKGQVVDDSGVRIGPLDLKIATVDFLEQLGFHKDIIELLTPYMQINGEKALTLIRSKPFRLTRDQYETIDSRMKSYYQQLFDSLTGEEKKDPIIKKLNQFSKEGDWPEFLNLWNKFLNAPRIMIRGSIVTALPLKED